MGKKFRGRTCVYCTIRRSNTGEHIFSREFFTIANRANLPKAPVCSICNGEKSKLEHYLTAVLPFGGRHPDAAETLESMVPRRLEKNVKLHRKLSARSEQFWARANSGLWMKTTALPFDGDKLVAYFGYVARGLMWFHWRVCLAAESFVLPMCITQEGETMIHRMLRLNANARVSANLGNGTVEYEGAQGLDRPDISAWLFQLYGGIVLSGSSSAQHQGITTAVGVLTGPRRVQIRSQWRAGHGDLTLGALFPRMAG